MTDSFQSSFNIDTEEALPLHSVESSDGADTPPDNDSISASAANDNTPRSKIKAIVGLSLLMEGITCVLRFGLGMESTRDTASTVGRLTGGIRIHHGYVGVLAVLGARCCHPQQRNRRRVWWMQVIGWSLIWSDLMHHFLVLWPLTGSPHFDLVYHQ